MIICRINKNVRISNLTHTSSLCHTFLNHKDIPVYSITVRKIWNGIEATDHFVKLESFIMELNPSQAMMCRMADLSDKRYPD